MKFGFAEYLEKQSNNMRKLFYDMSKHREEKEILEFLREFEENVNEHITEKSVRDMTFGNLVRLALTGSAQTCSSSHT